MFRDAREYDSETEWFYEFLEMILERFSAVSSAFINNYNIKIQVF